MDAERAREVGKPAPTEVRLAASDVARESTGEGRLNEAGAVRLKAGATGAVRLKADTTGEVRLKAGATGAVRVEADATGDVRLKVDTTSALPSRSEYAAQPLPTLGPLDARGTITYYIASGTDGSEYKPEDRQLAEWALEAWARSSDGALRFEAAPETEALVRVHWVPAAAGQYGEMRPVLVNGRRGAAVYVRPDTSALGPDIARMAREDTLLRDTIVYLTCLHELGHALGLSHTAEYRDIMYFFGYGGDIPGFFTRYRTRLRTREDIARASGLSDADIRTLRALYASSTGR